MYRTTVLVLIAKKYRSQWTMNVQRGLKNNIIHIQMEKIWGVISMWGVLNSAETLYSGSWIVLHKSRILMVLQIKPILSMMGIITAFSIRIRSYRCWMRLSRRSYGCATKTSYETILCSQYLWARILTLQHKCIALSVMEDCRCEAFPKGNIKILQQLFLCDKMRPQYVRWEEAKYTIVRYHCFTSGREGGQLSAWHRMLAHAGCVHIHCDWRWSDQHWKCFRSW